jgi:FdhD protein
MIHITKQLVRVFSLVLMLVAPALAADAADRLGLTLIGFLRGDGFNVYTHPERVAG